jgi:hypothetical protein
MDFQLPENLKIHLNKQNACLSVQFLNETGNPSDLTANIFESGPMPTP